MPVYEFLIILLTFISTIWKFSISIQNLNQFYRHSQYYSEEYMTPLLCLSLAFSFFLSSYSIWQNMIHETPV